MSKIIVSAVVAAVAWIGVINPAVGAAQKGFAGITEAVDTRDAAVQNAIQGN